MDPSGNYHADSILPVVVFHYRDTNEETFEPANYSKASELASKNLAYGFGPGKKTKILEVAKHQDGEENFGKYQELSYEKKFDNKKFDNKKRNVF